MDTAVTIAEAKEQLEELIARARRGEVVTIDDGKGSVRVVAEHVSPRPKRIAGQWIGKIQVPARLLEPLTDDELRWLSGEETA